jgi:hypothetical protein
MKIKRCFKTGLALSVEKIENYIFKCNNRKNPEDFSRSRKLCFKNTVYFMLNMVKKTLQLELNSFFENILKEDFTVTKTSLFRS